MENEIKQEEVKLTDALSEIKDEQGQQVDPKVEAVMFLKSAIPSFRNRLNDDNVITGTQAKRILSALIESPLENETPSFTTKEAEDMFTLGLMITNAKHILFAEGLKQELQSVQNEQIENKGEDSNG